MKFENKYSELMKFSREFLLNIRKCGKPIFLCVGSDKFVSDSLGPVVAEYLRSVYNIPCYVYGGLECNINASNLQKSVNYVETMHPNSPIVLIDATLGDNIGEIRLEEGSFAGLGRTLPVRKIGTFSVLGVVGKKSGDFNLNSTRLKVVVDMCKFIAKGVYLAVNRYCQEDIDKNRIEKGVFN